MKSTLFLLVLLMLMNISCKQSEENMHPWEDHGWKLAVQAWTFNRFTFEEALEAANKLGLKYIEAYPGQKITEGSEATTHFSMSEETKNLVRELTNKYDIKIINYGIVAAGSEEEWEQLFAFAADMGIKTIGSEPDPIWMDLIEGLVKKYDVQLAIHNHPPPTRYWNPQTVLDVIEGRDSRIGVSADNGHWMRSGLNPIDVYKMLEGRIKYLHLKDMTAFDDMDAHTVPFGTGVFNMREALQVLKETGFKGVITIEHEWDWENPAPKVAKSIEHLREISREL
ncbi:sugar phosphate isomerase/epimerase family protein [Natronoflexus pectinivorans]|uniref:Sugar phosphate isomerase/epimerase n=1 Tax=Natronoflexus pectinivorans TaxID=682526 RepID=A0A4V2RWG0_9BACT|nr:sugar phosphate isomerase/epimerase family protein [Natronoflexus pectinivorans]TCO08246.1 sugar phosphate isomerase/epimerase [Natronoflexus pectinivorans]